MKNCFLIATRKPKVAVVYIYPRLGARYDEQATRFVGTYLQFKPKDDHRLWCISNGGPPTNPMIAIMGPTGCAWTHHSNLGWDIGAFQYAAKTIDCDIIVFFGSSAYIRAGNWLERVIESVDKYGLGIYGCMGHMGDAGARVWPHIRTTGFWMHPGVLNSYPYPIIASSQRYEFEHGKTCLCEWAKNNGLKGYVVTTNGEYEFPHWSEIPNGYHRGDQSALLSGDRLTDPPYYPYE